MWNRLRTTSIACSIAVVSVAAVPAFAQTNSASRADTWPSFVPVNATPAARLYRPHVGAAAAEIILPPNLTYAPMFGSVLDAMLRRSPTFRRQCVRLAQAGKLSVAIRGVYPNARLASRARTTLVAEGGRLLATVEIPPLDDMFELIAHELEHIIEQLDGVDLKARAELSGAGVTACADG